MPEGLRFYGVWRMDWGLGNPNLTAAVIAMLMIAVCGLGFIRKWGFWVALPLVTGLGVCLLHTMSRGGLVALLAGSVPLAIIVRRPWSRTRILAICGAVAIVVASSIYLKTHKRFSNGIAQEDRSITNRLVIWRDVPRMMLDAPGGWGWKQAATAYMQWYQDVDRPERYRNLVNSHFTWLVEMNWLLRIAYVLAWGGVLLLCFSSQAHGGLSVPLGVWIAFGTAGFFTHVAESIYVWILPLLFLLVGVALRVKWRAWPSPRQWGVSAMAGLIILACFVGSSYMRGSSGIHRLPGAVTIGAGTPKIWMIADQKVVGDSYGKTIRRYLATQPDSPSIAIAESAVAVSGGPGVTVAICGTPSPADLIHLNSMLGTKTRLIALNPAFFPQELSNIALNQQLAEAVFGEFSQSPALSAWKGVATIRQLEGVGDFIPGWPELLLTPAL